MATDESHDGGRAPDSEDSSEGDWAEALVDSKDGLGGLDEPGGVLAGDASRPMPGASGSSVALAAIALGKGFVGPTETLQPAKTSEANRIGIAVRASIGCPF